MKQPASFILIFSLIVFVFVISVECQLLDQLMNNGNQATGSQQKETTNGGFRSMFRDMMSVNVPLVYDMTRNGSSMGINVLSGLVKFERGEEAAKSGLEGARPMSIRVFGIPVYERGRRVRFPGAPPSREVPAEQPTPGSESESESSSDDEELPIIP